MGITQNKTVNFILVNIVLPVVLSLIVSYAYDKMKAKNEPTTKAEQPPKQSQETIEVETASA